MPNEVARSDPGQDVPEFLFEDFEVNPAVAPGGCPIHLAIDAIEIADLVGIQIDADRHPSRTPAEDGIDVPVFVELPSMIVNGERPLCHTL